MEAGIDDGGDGGGGGGGGVRIEIRWPGVLAVPVEMSTCRKGTKKQKKRNVKERYERKTAHGF